MSSKQKVYRVEDFYFLKVKAMWQYFWSEHPAFWCICGYLFVEYFRPQSIYPAIDFLPWAKLFLLGSLALSFTDKSSKTTWSMLHFWLCAFFLQLNISILFAYNAWWSDFYYINAMQWFVVILAISRIVVTRERMYVFSMVLFICSLKLSLGTAMIWAGRGFAFTSWGIKGPPGFFENSGELAIQMLVAFSFAYYLFQAREKPITRLEYAILILAIATPVLTILGASSRGSQLALAFIMVLLAGTKLFKIKYLIIFSLICVVTWQLLPEAQKNRFQGMGSDRTSEQRLLYWTRGMEMILEHPFTGVGYYNFIPYFSDVYPNDVLFVNQRGERIAELPHNIVIQVGTDGGIPAVLLYLAIVLGTIRTKTNKEDLIIWKIDKGISVGIIGFFIAGQFVSVAYYPFLWIGVGFKLGLQTIGRNSELKVEKYEQRTV